MKIRNKVSAWIFCAVLAVLAGGQAGARTLVFTYTTAHTIFAYNNQPIRFTVTRDFKTQGNLTVTGLNQSLTMTLHDDGGSAFRPYFLNIYVAPFRGQGLPYPTFIPQPGAGQMTISVDGGVPVSVLLVIDPFDHNASGPMAVSFIF